MIAHQGRTARPRRYERGVARLAAIGHRMRMPRPSDRRSRLVALLLLVALATGLTATSSAASTLPPCRIADTLTMHRATSDWARALVDQTYRLSAAHAPSDLRSTVAAGLASGFMVRRRVIADLKAMAIAARAAGARFAVQSAYRSYATQRSTFAYWVRVDGYAKASRESARAGHSEHQLGTALDFRSHGGSAPWDSRDWGTSKAGAWLSANAWKYGFVMSYPKGKSAVTCYAYEPWHYRYVGRARAATIRASGLTLREFLWAEQTAPTPSPTDAPSSGSTVSAEPSFLP